MIYNICVSSVASYILIMLQFGRHNRAEILESMKYLAIYFIHTHPPCRIIIMTGLLSFLCCLAVCSCYGKEIVMIMWQSTIKIPKFSLHHFRFDRKGDKYISFYFPIRIFVFYIPPLKLILTKTPTTINRYDNYMFQVGI